MRHSPRSPHDMSGGSRSTRPCASPSPSSGRCCSIGTAEDYLVVRDRFGEAALIDALRRRHRVPSTTAPGSSGIASSACPTPRRLAVVSNDATLGDPGTAAASVLGRRSARPLSRDGLCSMAAQPSHCGSGHRQVGRFRLLFGCRPRSRRKSRSGRSALDEVRALTLATRPADAWCWRLGDRRSAKSGSRILSGGSAHRPGGRHRTRAENGIADGLARWICSRRS